MITTFKVQMPNAGLVLESCLLVKWFKKVGERVNKGEPLFSYETDKTIAEETAPENGVLAEIYFKEGDEVPVMADVCSIKEIG